MSEQLKALPKHITDDIRSILERCESGELRHYQGEFHCGTSHCIAGWKAVLDFAKEQKEPEALTARFNGRWMDKLDDFMCNAEGELSEWNYAKEKWRLTEEEANALFSDDATFVDQFELLDLLERGERFEYSFDKLK